MPAARAWGRALYVLRREHGGNCAQHSVLWICRTRLRGTVARVKQVWSSTPHVAGGEQDAFGVEAYHLALATWRQGLNAVHCLLI